MHTEAVLRTRFAPTPSGWLHIGNAFSFVLTWLIARQHNGTLLLRIDDLDATRKRPEYVADIFESLDWLGLDFDLGPQGPDEFERSFSQRHRMSLYEASLTQLQEQACLFACDCTRRSIQQDNAQGFHPPSCRAANLPLTGTNLAWRIGTTPQTSTVRWQDRDDQQRQVDLHQAMRDFVVRRKDGIPAYQLASLVDDVYFQIDLIVRGLDLLDSTAAQRWLAQHLDCPQFSTTSFLHHALLPNAEGHKLSKSEGDTSLRVMRAADPDAQNVYRQLSSWLGLQQPVTSAAEALAVWTA